MIDIFALRDAARANDLANRMVEPDLLDTSYQCTRWDQCAEGFGHRGSCRPLPASDTEPGILERLRRYSS